MILIFNLLLNFYFIYFLIGILVNQYYSLKRFFKVLKDILIKNIDLILLSLFINISIVSSIYYIYPLKLVLLFIFIVKNHSLKLKFTRRNIFLLVLTSILSLFCLPSILIGSIGSLLIAYFLLIPLEYFIKSRYISLAKAKLKRIDPLIIGISGSYGKTSFKYILSSVLSTKYNISFPPGNINTPLGIVKYINNNLEGNTDLLVLELGIDEVRGMEKFKKIFSLDIAVLTTIGENHIVNFKSLDNTLKAKYKIKELLKKEGKLFVNNDDKYLEKLDEEKFSKHNINKYPLSIKGTKIKYNKSSFYIPLYGEYVYSYIDGAIKIGEFLGINKDLIEIGLRKVKSVSRRMEVKKFSRGYLIDNSYNINKESAKVSIELLDKLNGNNVVIIGGLIEQGKYYSSNNQEIQKLLVNHSIIFIGESSHPLIDNHKFKKLYIVKHINEAYKLLEEYKFDNVLILAKGEDIYLK